MKWFLALVVLVVLYLVNESVERDQRLKDAELRSRLLEVAAPR